ncbi:cryptochrome/photolyase family protein [Marinicella pacifica]|uniref:Cryptochrome/photolyase family protein n=1 Tax=Marinicella pacifica TaxID=1171543 RepID=A0A917CTE2_9GAMM|nr:cryptochrome/photolyase family protein [Marinicella pacifica]GGF96547.1 cryptochrome/photolyase family protein [Marinicella pacifica]
MKSATIIFPHQLFADLSAIKNHSIYLVETDLFFNQYPFHKQKIAFHRATMKAYEAFIEPHVASIHYIEAHTPLADIYELIKHLANNNIDRLNIYPTHDDWLNQQIRQGCQSRGLDINTIPSHLFLNKTEDLAAFFKGHENLFHHHFYQQQRRRHKLLMQGNKPCGGQWSFDGENRKKYPKNKQPPKLKKANWTSYHEQAAHYTEEYFGDHYGFPMAQDNDLIYPITHQQAQTWLADFVQHRLAEFGPYEDAICFDQRVLNHSLLTPMLNIGLLTPKEVISAVLSQAKEHHIPINSLEGFIRQIIGWREYIHGLYHFKGRKQRCSNAWNHQRPMPKGFYNGETGIDPVDQTIHKVLSSGYCHHIERLMVLGNFMFLCEIHPKAVYRWFMELFIDAYDWVMVPNVYGMSQFADGGLMSTKPYISGSNYIRKMSDYASGDWCEVWDGLYWRIIDKHLDYFKNNRRTAMMASNWLRQDTHKKKSHLAVAEDFLAGL